MVTIPAFFGLTLTMTMPLASEGLEVMLSVEPLILTRTPFTALPFWVILIVSVTLRPTNSVLGATPTAVQTTAGGTNLPFTTTEADAVLLAVFVSASLPTTVAVFGIVPVTFAVVTIVIVAV